MNSFYSKEELLKLNFKKLGDNVLLSKKASIYNAELIEIGNNVRIDDFCILSGKITVGNYVHISAGSLLFSGVKKSEIIIENYSSISSRCAIYSISDDYSGSFMANPMLPDDFRYVTEKTVIIKENSLVGTGCTILPGVIIDEGCAFGAMSLINKSTKPWGVYYGIPCRRVKERKKHLLKYVKMLSYDNGWLVSNVCYLYYNAIKNVFYEEHY